MVVCALYNDAADPRTHATVKAFFADYKKRVPVKEFITNFSLSLEVMAEDSEFERMEKTETEVAKWLVKALGISRKPKILRRWRN